MILYFSARGDPTTRLREAGEILLLGCEKQQSFCVRSVSHKLIMLFSCIFSSDHHSKPQPAMNFLCVFISLLSVDTVLSTGGLRKHSRQLANDKKCTSVELYSDNAVFQAALEDVGTVGNSVSSIPIFDVTTDENVGLFTLLAFDLQDGKNFEDGFVSLFKAGSTTEVAGTVTYAGPAPVNADSTLDLTRGDFTITGGTGAYACAEGILLFKGFTPDFSQFRFDVVTCGGFCDPYSI